jgi:HSP20 family protein
MAIRDLVPWRKSIPVRREHGETTVLPFPDVNRLFDRFFDAAFHGEPFDWTDGLGGFPRVDVSEDDTEVVVSAELPGVEESEVEVSVRDDALTIAGERRDESEHRDRDFYRREQYYGSFQRTIPLPRGIDPDRVEATFKRGVLTVTMPKTEAARRRKISIRAA